MKKKKPPFEYSLGKRRLGVSTNKSIVKIYTFSKQPFFVFARKEIGHSRFTTKNNKINKYVSKETLSFGQRGNGRMQPDMSKYVEFNIEFNTAYFV